MYLHVSMYQSISIIEALGWWVLRPDLSSGAVIEWLLFSSLPKVLPGVTRSVSCYRFFCRRCLPEGDAAQSQVSSGNTGQSIFRLLGVWAFSLSLKSWRKGCWEYSCLWVLHGQNLLQCEVYRDSMLAGNSHRFQGIWRLGKRPRLMEVIPSCFGLLECAHSPCLCSPASTIDHRAALCDFWKIATLLVVHRSPLVQRIVKSLLQSRSGTFCGYVTNRDEWVRKTFDCRQTAEADGVNPDMCGATWKLSLVQHRLCV